MIASSVLFFIVEEALSSALNREVAFGKVYEQIKLETSIGDGYIYRGVLIGMGHTMKK